MNRMRDYIQMDGGFGLEPIEQPLYDARDIPLNPIAQAQIDAWNALPWWTRAFWRVHRRVTWTWNPLARAWWHWKARRAQRRFNIAHFGNPEGRCDECGEIHSPWVLH